MNPYTAKPIVVDAPQFATRLTQEMTAKGIGVRALALATKVDKATISAWRIGGQTRVQVATVQKVASALGTTAEHLLDMPLSSVPHQIEPEQLELLRRVAALKPTLSELLKPPPDLVEALEKHGQRLASIEQVLPTLCELVDAASILDGST